jgi:hypothetical protein
MASKGKDLCYASLVGLVELKRPCMTFLFMINCLVKVMAELPRLKNENIVASRYSTKY